MKGKGKTPVSVGSTDGGKAGKAETHVSASNDSTNTSDLSMAYNPVSHVVAVFLRAIAGFSEKRTRITDKTSVIALLREFSEYIDAGYYDGDIDNLLMLMPYEKNLKFCAEHKFICLEYHRRHRNSLKHEREIL